MPVSTIEPFEARDLMNGGATLVDIRDADEHARDHIPGAKNVPMSRISELPAGPVIFHCRSGLRTRMHEPALVSAANGAHCYIVAGGIEAWRAAGLPTKIDRTQPLEIMRQVQLTAGSLVLVGVVLGIFLSPLFFGVSAFVGAGLMMAGATGWCGMANLLRFMPWNRPAQNA